VDGGDVFAGGSRRLSSPFGRGGRGGRDKGRRHVQQEGVKFVFVSVRVCMSRAEGKEMSMV
jgi:hypothetical protein